jgi:hypothetical protein
MNINVMMRVAGRRKLRRLLQPLLWPSARGTRPRTLRPVL